MDFFRGLINALLIELAMAGIILLVWWLVKILA